MDSEDTQVIVEYTVEIVGCLIAAGLLVFVLVV